MPTRVFLGHLSRDASDRDIERLFKNYGNIREVTLKNGFGFVDFDNSKDAEDVVNDFHGKPFLSESFGPPERTAHRLMVENLAHGVSWQMHLHIRLGNLQWARITLPS
ncbi:hypothetical protein BGZ95_006492 [Linnemannia exigua]|uniref:RRM domain-containing protein n=1 Tax=Linnemannia exigua TaxID=604196 RepID=A0AAD4DFY9_9FUNG|nr:hypothetical protein BGZ95_006492 [Linnemannia exigua]